VGELARNPEVLEALGTVSGALGSLQKASGATALAGSEAAAASYRAAVARNNEVLAGRAAEDALAVGKLEVARSARGTRQLIARQRVALAGRGVLLDAGTPLGLELDALTFGKLDQLTIQNIAEREALGFRTQAANFRSEAALEELGRRNALLSGRILSRSFQREALGTLATGFTKEDDEGTTLATTASTVARFVPRFSRGGVRRL